MKIFKKRPKLSMPETRPAIMVELLRRQTAQISAGKSPDSLAKLINECELICNYVDGVYKIDAEEILAMFKGLS